MGKVLGIVNTKGGIGKTTVASALASEFSRRGLKTLVVDFDSQASFTHLVGLNASEYMGSEHDIVNIFEGKNVKPLKIRENLYLIPSNKMLKQYAESGKTGKENFLRIALKGDEFEEIKGIAEDFDIVIVDSEGGGGTLETSVQVASDYILIPMRPTVLDETGTLQTLMSLINNIKIFRLRELVLLGFIAVDFDRRAKEPLERYAALRKEIPEILSQVKFLKTAVEPKELFLPELYRRTVWVKAFSNYMFIHDYIEKHENYSRDVLNRLKEIGDEVLKRLEVS